MGIGLALRVHNENWGAGALGGLQAMVGLGALCGAVVLIRRRPRQEARLGFGLLLLQGLAILALGAPGPGPIIGACLVIGVTSGAASALLSAVFMRSVDPAYLGRLASIQRLGDDVLMPAAMSGFGALAAGAGSAAAFAVFGGAMALLMLAALRRVDLQPT